MLMAYYALVKLFTVLLRNMLWRYNTLSETQDESEFAIAS